MFRLLFLFCLLSVSISSTAQLQIDSTTSYANFSIRNLAGKTTGTFTGMSGEYSLDTTQLSQSYINVTIKVSTINTQNDKRDAHLKNQDFFDIEQFPIMSFSSINVFKEKDQLLVTGNLTIKNITKKITVPLLVFKSQIKGNFEINRKDFNVHNSSFLTKGIGKKVAIDFTINPIK